jgi:hypothetical protein
MLKIVSEGPSEDKPNPILPLQEAFRAELDRRGPPANFAEREAAGVALANELVRGDLQETLEELAQTQGDYEVLVDGELYRFHRLGSATYHSLCGPLNVKRPSFRRVGERNGPSVIPLELAAGLVERATPLLAERIAMGRADGPSRDVVRQLEASGRVPPSRTTIEGIGKRIGLAMHQKKRSIEAVARRAEALPPGVNTISIGLDRTTAPMEEDLPEGTPRRPRKKPRIRQAPSPVTVQYRMAYVGTVALVDADGEVQQTFKYGATVEDGPQTVLHAMMQDVRNALRQKPGLNVAVIQDAGKEMWTLVIEALRREPSVKCWEEIVDHYHAMAHLWRAAQAMEGEAKSIMDRWRAQLRANDRAIDGILREIQLDAMRNHEHSYCVALEDEITFVTNNGARMKYASLRDAGFPIGSGPTEGACKSFFSVRCKRSGQRWRNPGLRATLECRAQLLNERLPSVMRNLRHQNYRAEVVPVLSVAA